jgi:hypothetical protein
MDLHLPAWARRSQPERTDIRPFYGYLTADERIDLAHLETGGKEIPLLLVTLALAKETTLERRILAADRLSNTQVDPYYGLPWLLLLKAVDARLEKEDAPAARGVQKQLRQRVFELAFSSGLVMETRAAREAMGTAPLPDVLVKSLAKFAPTSESVQLAMDLLAHDPMTAVTADALTNLQTKLREVRAHATL